jgi:hypothetical protein
MYPLFPTSLSHNNAKSERATAPGLVMDIRDLTFDDGTFDIVIDKGKPFGSRTVDPPGLHMRIRIGTMDAMMTAKGDVWVGSIVFRHPALEPPHLPTGSSATGHRRLHKRGGRSSPVRPSPSLWLIEASDCSPVRLCSHM